MKLVLHPLSVSEVVGIYGPKKNELPARMRWLHPAAADSHRQHLQGVIVSDMYRSAESSLLARRERRGAQRPGYSGHGYGFCEDLSVDATMKKLGLKTKLDLDAFMATAGWYCHRRDGKRGHEDWHFTFFLADEFAHLVRPKDQFTADGLERKIQAHYGKDFVMNAEAFQAGLAKIGFYKGEIDGKFGPLSREATQAFQRAWQLEESGKMGPTTMRTLAFVTAER